VDYVGFLLRGRLNLLATGGASLLAAIIFYTVSKFEVWAGSGIACKLSRTTEKLPLGSG
jgi:hypothetical protein